MHFTHVENLAKVMEHGHLKSDKLVRSEGLTIADCAESGIKVRRHRRSVPVAPHGRVSEYVPFYYNARSPMMSSIAKGNVNSYSEGQEPLVYIGSRLSVVDSMRLPWVASDGNCASSMTQYFGEWDAVEEGTDWDVIADRYWADTKEDGDRKRRRMAEFLVHQRFPVEAILAIVTMTLRAAEQVREIVGNEYRVLVCRDWYF